jgi:hypothetical protein
VTWRDAAAVAGVVGVAGLALVATRVGPAPLTADQTDTAVVLAEDPPPPPAPTPTTPSPPSPPEERVDVICSDLRVRSVPVSEVSTDVPGELVELANGPCVVMGPEGATVP